MWHYTPPLRDMRFAIDEVLALPRQWAALPAFADLDADTAHQVMEEAGKFASQVLVPINAGGDLEGCTLRDGRVSTPKGFREAYRAFVDAGWPSLACDPEAGGQGLPQVLSAVLNEMLAAANHAWTMYPGLLHGAYECLHAHATPELKDAYLSKVVSGEWLGTMCLTEAHAGSDLGLLKTRAEPQRDGSYRVRGTKIFISGGDHDLTENILHLVLARLPDAPAGTKGLSLFLVPKNLPAGQGFKPNALRCDGIEKKMGVKGSATCVMSFEGATGWLIGEANRGLAAMFSMMNAARLHTAMQGVGHAEAAFQNALRYACERLQMRAVSRPAGSAAGEVDPIVLHPAMRHALLRQRALVEGCRLLAYETAHWLDLAERHPEADARRRALDRVSLLTPVAKAFFTETGFMIASDALQVFGGHGYVHDYGIEQCLRDSRIAMIYEGTNEIQAIDLLVRKVVPDGGAKLTALVDSLTAALPAGDLALRARGALAAFSRTTQQVVQAAAADAELPYRVAGDYLRMAALTLLAQGWARADAVAAASVSPFHAAKRETARYYMDYLLPEAELCLRRIAAGWQSLPFLPLAAA